MKSLYPLMISLNGRRCIVIGGGKVAERKVTSLVEINAPVTIISPKITPNLEKLTKDKKIIYKEREYEKGDLEGNFLVIIATDNNDINLKIYNDVDHSSQLVNIVDEPELCTYIVPSIVNRGNLKIAISTQGASPGLSKRIRKEIENIYGEEYIDYTNFLESMRKWIFTLNLSQKDRREFFNKILEEQYLQRIAVGDREIVEKELKSIYDKDKD